MVYTFILEPSDEKSKNTHEKHAIKSTITHSNKTISSHKNTHTKISIEKVPTPIKVEPSTAHKVVKSHPVTKHDVKVPSAQKVVHIITKPQSVETAVISTPTIPKVVHVPKNTLTKPSVPTVPSLPSIQNIKQEASPIKTETLTQSKKETLSADVTKVADKVEKALSKESSITPIKQTREQVIQEAEDLRQEVMKLLER